MPISPSEYDDATAGESKDERKSALAAPPLSEEVYTFDPHQRDTFPNSGPSRRDSSNSTSAGFPMQHTKTRDLNAELGKDGVGRVPSIQKRFWRAALLLTH